MNVLVTDGNSKPALAITRSLGARGYRLFVASSEPSCLAACSKYSLKSLTYPDPAIDRIAFIDGIKRIVKENAIDILIPVSDVCVLPIAENIGRLKRFCRIPLPSFDALSQAADKNGLLDVARKLGIGIPDSVTLTSYDQLDVARIPMELPLVIKPSRSRIRHGDGWIFTGVDYASSNDELHSKLRAIPDEAYPVILQERVKGQGIGVFYCFDHGRLVASFAHRRIREKPPSGGVSVLCESMPIHPVAYDYGLRLLNYLGWHGVAMVEFKLDSQDQEPKLMEINGRFWGSLQLAINSGVDFPYLLAQIADGCTPDNVNTYRTGVRSRWLWGEIDLFLMYALKSEASLNLPSGHNGRLMSIIKILNPYVRNQHFDVLRLSDVKPWICETIGRLKS